MPGTILELRTANPRRAATLLRQHLSGCSVGLFGDRVHVASRDPDTARIHAASILAGEGIALEAARPVAPTLEDVFVSVLAKQPEADPHA
jgi:ABC-2 type transport system ATP-binding protein